MNLNKSDLDFQDKKITVMGLGLHGGGVGVTKWLAQQGANILVTDLRDKKSLAKSVKELNDYKIKFVLGKHRAEDFKTADLIIKNPGVPKESKFLQIASQNNIPIETDISLFFRICQAPIIGITGTKGKSTTTTLIYNLLKQANKYPVMAGNIRVSPLTVLAKIKKDTPVVLELSSWQLEDMAHIKVSPHIAVITNIMPDHLNRYRSLNDYIKAKKTIFKYQRPNDFTILNYDNEITRKLGKEIIAKKYWISSRELKEKNGCFIRKGWIIIRQNGKESIICPIKDIKIPGQHNLENALAAMAAGKVYGIKNIIIRRVIKQFKGIPDRLELIRRWKGVKFYNDTTATAPVATIAALNCFKEKVVLIAGGYDKNLAYNKLAEAIKRQADFVVLFRGTASDKIIKELKKIGYQTWQMAKSMPQAVAIALANKKNISSIVLSPGAASFGMFLNEFDRGEQFKKVIKKLH